MQQKGLLSGMIVSMLLWGVNWPSGKVLLRFCSVVNLMVYRFVFVVVGMLILLPLFGINLRVKKAGIPVILISGGMLALYNYLSFMGLKSEAAGAGGVLVTTLNPIIAYGIGMLSNRRLPSRYEAVGLLLGLFAGCILLRVWDNSALLAGGNLYFLLAAFTWAVMSTFTARGGQYGSSMGFSLWQYMVTLLCLLPITNITEMKAALHIREALFWSNLVFGAVIVTSLATTVYFYATTRIGPEKSSSFLFLVPFAAAASSWLFLGEKILLQTAVGGIMGIAAVYLINKRKGRISDIVKER